MYALSGQEHSSFTTLIVLVVSRFYRRVRRFVLRLFMAEIQVPQHAGLFAVVLFLSAFAAYGVKVGGHSDEVIKLATSVLGFSLNEVEVVGNQRLSHDDVVSVLGVDDTTSMIGFDVVAARDTLAKLPWVQSVDVQKVYPNNLRVSLVERQPFAVWQHKDTLDKDVFEIVDKEGKVIAEFKQGFAMKLPLIVGFGAKEKAAGFVAKVAQYPQIANKVRAYVRVGGRRWDILLQNGVRVKLPEDGALARLAELVEVDKTEGLLSRDVLSVDLRLSDRMVVALSDEAMARREDAVKEDEKRLQAKKAGRI